MIRRRPRVWGAPRRAATHLAALALALWMAPGCGKQRADDSPTGVVKQFLAASIKRDTDERHKALYDLLGPRTQARLKAAAQQATAATGGKRTYKPHEMLSASFRPSAKGDWVPKKFKLLGKTAQTARVQVTGEKKGQVQVVELVKVEGKWRIELPGGPPPRPTPRPTPAPR